MRAKAVGVAGLGYLGLVTAVCFAAKGLKTVGIEVNPDRLASISRGRAPIFERGVNELLAKVLSHGRLTVTSDYEALRAASTVFITVGTPSSAGGLIDLSSVESSSRSVGKTLQSSEGYRLVVVKSTVVPGTTDGPVRRALESESGMKLGEFGLAANPEFLREGRAVDDTMRPDRIVIGASDHGSERAMVSFYRRFYGRLPRTIRTNPATAELIKYASNAFLATKISYINEIAKLCAKIPGSDVRLVSESMGLDKRIAPGFLNAGLGWGGSCLPKDVDALLGFAKSKGVGLLVPEAARKANRDQPLLALEIARKHLGDLSGKKVALLGLAFKSGTDDVREAVSVALAKAFAKAGAAVVAYDPVATANARRFLGDSVAFAKSARSCVEGTDCCVVATEWDEFRSLRPSDFDRMNRRFLIDGRRIFDPTLFRGKMEFEAVGLGA